MPFFVQLLIPVAVLVGLAALIWKGASNGDQLTDAVAHVSLERHEGHEAKQLLARVKVSNRTNGTVIVAARAVPMSWLNFQTDFPMLSSTASVHNDRLQGRELLGAVESGEEHVWTFPVLDAGRRYLRVVVEIDQPERRTRVISTTHDTAKV